VEPHVGRALAASRLLRADQARRHVRLTLDRVGVEVVGARGADVSQDRVVLGRPAPSRLGAVIVGPDDLVQERLAPEQLVEQQLAVVSLAVVDVEVQGAVGRHQLTSPNQPRLEEREVVGEGIVIAQRLEQARAVAPASESNPGCARIGDDRDRVPGLCVAGVERRIHVHDVEARVGQAAHRVLVVPGQHEIVVEYELLIGGLDPHDRQT